MISQKVLKRFSVLQTIFVFAALLVCLGPVNVTAAELDRSDFAFVINLSESDSHQPSLWLLGKYKAGIALTLLLSEPPYICAAKTTSRRAKMDSSQSDLTRVASTCKITKWPRIAVIKKPVIDYKPVALNAINDKKQILSIDHAIKNSKALLLLTKRAQGTTHGQMKGLKGIFPKIHEFSMYDQEAIIASYSSGKLSDGNIPNPRVLLLNDRVYPLTGWCSFDDIAVFSLNGHYYIWSGSACCNCGISIIELSQVTQDGPVMVRSDASLSD